jgi:hypothetical protein
MVSSSLVLLDSILTNVGGEGLSRFFMARSRALMIGVIRKAGVWACQDFDERRKSL